MAIKNEPSLGSFGKEFQEKLVQLILDDSVFASQINEVLDVSFFELKYLQVFVDYVFKYNTTYGCFPNRSTVETILRSELDKQTPVMQKQVRDFFARVLAGTIEDIEDDYVKDKSLDFCKKQKLKEAMLKSVSLMENSSFDEVSKVINNALKLGLDNEHGYDFMKHFEERYKLKARDPISTGWDVIDNFIQGGHGKGELGVVVAPTGCHAKGTKILMFDGHYKNVEDIVVGDVLMGPDSRPRNVLHLHRGREEMYNINPTKGKSFIVNKGHILSLVRTNDGTCFAGSKINISVEDYINCSKTFKHTHKLYRPDFIEFQSVKVQYPYIVGLYLGDGAISGDGVVITTADAEIADEIQYFATIMNCKTAIYQKSNSAAKDIRMLGGHSNNIWKMFEKIGIAGTRSDNKFIPHEYKTSDLNSRLQLLAGLLDTDGSCDKHGCFDFISKSKILSEDVVFLAQSVGLAAYMKETQKCDQNGFIGTYYRVCISGDTNIIPTRISRKRAKERTQIKNHRRVGFEVTDIGIDDYYGFEVDCDNLYVMQDFFVTHNSGKSMMLVHLAAQAMKQGKNVVYYTLELGDTVIGRRFDSCLTGFPLKGLNLAKEEVFEKVREIPGKLIIKEYPTKSVSTETLRNHLKKLEQRDFKVDMIVVDYGDLLKPVTAQREKRNELEGIYEELRGIAAEFKCPLWTASQTNRSGLNAEVVTMESISEAFNKCFVADFIFSLSRTATHKQNNTGRIFIAKNRNGPDGVVLPIFMDTSNVAIKVMEPTNETVDEINKNAAADQAKKLKERYAKHRKEQKELKGE